MIFQKKKKVISPFYLSTCTYLEKSLRYGYSPISHTRAHAYGLCATIFVVQSVILIQVVCSCLHVRFDQRIQQ
jgi:hypothetical protein